VLKLNCMRIISIILLGAGLVGAAETAKPPAAATTPAPRLNTAEIVAFSAVEARMKSIREEFDALTKQRAEIVADTCRRALSVPACDIRPDGTIAKLAEVK